MILHLVRHPRPLVAAGTFILAHAAIAQHDRGILQDLARGRDDARVGQRVHARRGRQVGKEVVRRADWRLRAFATACSR